MAFAGRYCLVAIAGDELFSDTFPIKLIDDMYYEVDGKVKLHFRVGRPSDAFKFEHV